jgi:hypothetical protein
MEEFLLILVRSRMYCEGLEKATRGGEWEPIKILMQELAYVPSSNPKAKTRLARYDQNREQTLLLKLPGGHVGPWTRYVRFWWIYPVIEQDMSGLPRNFLLNFDS